MALITDPNLPDTDAVYQRLIEAHDGLDDDASLCLNARLILLLANHIGDRDVVCEAIALAAEAAPGA